MINRGCQGPYLKTVEIRGEGEVTTVPVPISVETPGGDPTGRTSWGGKW